MQYPYTASSTGIAALFPQWSLEGGQKSLVERLAAPEQRARIKAVIVRKHQGGPRRRRPEEHCDRQLLLSTARWPAKTWPRSPARAAWSRPSKTPPRPPSSCETKGGCSAVYHAISEEDVVRIMRSPYTMIASDGEIPVFGQASPHPRSYGTFARVLGVYVREKHVLTLEDAIRKMSGYPGRAAQAMGSRPAAPRHEGRRGGLRPRQGGRPGQYDKPHQYSVGFRDVMVNGKIALRDDVVTAERGGRVLYGPSYGK